VETWATVLLTMTSHRGTSSGLVITIVSEDRSHAENVNKPGNRNEGEKMMNAKKKELD
jgi:uridine phosphorylase